MKIRYGFVSNSSSSSFTCCICGEEQSGMDMCLSDAGMVRCREGHIFCESHKLGSDLTLEEKKQLLIDLALARKYYKPEENQKKVDEIKAMTDADAENEFDEYNNEELFSCSCPLCQLLDLDYDEISHYYMAKAGLKTTKEVAAVVKSEFGTYKAFCNFIHPPKKD